MVGHSADFEEATTTYQKTYLNDLFLDKDKKEGDKC